MEVLSKQIDHIQLVLWGPKHRSYHVIHKCPANLAQEIHHFCIYSLGPTNPRFDGLEVYHNGETHIITAPKTFVTAGASRMVKKVFTLCPGDWIRINMYCGVGPFNIEVSFGIVTFLD